MSTFDSKSYLEMMDAIYLKKKLDLTYSDERKVANAYSNSIQNLASKLAKAKDGGLSERYYRAMMKSLYTELHTIAKTSVYSAADMAIEHNKDIMNQINYMAGMNKDVFAKTFANIPNDTLKQMISGGIYSDGAGLSTRIWNHTSAYMDYIQEVVNTGIISGQSAKEMAKTLEKHVKPSAARPLRSKAALEGLGAAYKKVDANSLRLARTSISHSFTLAQKMAAKDHPFQEGFIWHSVFSHGRTCQECKDRDGVYFSTKDLPYDHPNGMCWNEPHFEKPLDYYADRISDWVHTGDDMLLEKWYNKTYLGMGTKEAHQAAKDTINALKIAGGKTPKGAKAAQGATATNTSGATLTPQQAQFRTTARNYRKIDRYEVDDWDKGHYTKWESALKGGERDAVQEYTGSDYHWMNKHLRGLDPISSPSRLKTIENCKKALDKASVPEDVVVFRGTDRVMLNSTGVPAQTMKNWLSSGELHRLEGMVISDSGFMSTSVLGDTAFGGNLVLEIRVPAGTKGAYVKSLSHFARENELILQAGTKMVVQEAKLNYDTLKLIVEVVE